MKNTRAKPGTNHGTTWQQMGVRRYKIKEADEKRKAWDKIKTPELNWKAPDTGDD